MGPVGACVHAFLYALELLCSNFTSRLLNARLSKQLFPRNVVSSGQIWNEMMPNDALGLLDLSGQVRTFSFEYK